jgi:hypothetical protein
VLQAVALSAGPLCRCLARAAKSKLGSCDNPAFAKIMWHKRITGFGGNADLASAPPGALIPTIGY